MQMALMNLMAGQLMQAVPQNLVAVPVVVGTGPMQGQLRFVAPLAFRCMGGSCSCTGSRDCFNMAAARVCANPPNCVGETCTCASRF